MKRSTLDIPVQGGIRLSPMEAVLVELLFQNGESHGYAIAAAIGKSPKWIYVYLQRLQAKGLTSARSATHKRTGRLIRKVKLLPKVRRAYARIRDELA